LICLFLGHSGLKGLATIALSVGTGMLVNQLTNSNGVLQVVAGIPYFELYKKRLLTILSWLVMLKKKQACNYELEFVGHPKFVNSKFGAHFFGPL
jgi:uncharacterized membrane protein